MKALGTRVISAVIALVALLLLDWYGGKDAMAVLVALAVVLTLREFDRVAFVGTRAAFPLRVIFVAASLLLYYIFVYHERMAFAAFAVISCLMVSVEIWLARAKISNETLLPTLMLSNFGLVYCVLLPGFAGKILALPHGLPWFFALLVIVFFGDIAAFFGGYYFGKRPLMPALSPKKTVEGALCGAAGSVIAGGIFAEIYLPGLNRAAWLPLCLLAAVVAQSGDLFASLLKRVAHIKDSGSLMPGHGGVIDRLDGAYFASPVVYFFAVYAEMYLLQSSGP